MSRGVNPRPNVATRHAEGADLDRIRYTQTMGAWDGCPQMGRATSRVLSFLAAVNRSGETGFVGVRAPAVAVADAIARAQRMPMSERTYWRAIAELERLGLVERSTWGGGRSVLGKDGWYRRPISVITLSQTAINIWSRSRSKAVSPVSVHLPKWQGSDHDEIPSPPIGGHGESLRTCAIVVGRTPAPELRVAVSPVATLTGSARLAAAVPAGAIDGAGRRHAEKVEPQNTCRSGIAASPVVPELRTPSAPLGRLTSGLAPVPGRPGRATTWRQGATGWLAVLELLLAQGREPRAGRAAVDRARRELDPEHQRHPDDSGIDWPHWVWRWPGLSRTERWALARRELAPRLLGHELATARAAASKPGSENRKAAPWVAPSRGSVAADSSQAPRNPDETPCQTLAERLAVDQDFAEAMRRLGVNPGRGAPPKREP